MIRLGSPGGHQQAPTEREVSLSGTSSPTDTIIIITVQHLDHESFEFDIRFPWCFLVFFLDPVRGILIFFLS
jgi:hypothetical protein